jgi:hypothetical protein
MDYKILRTFQELDYDYVQGYNPDANGNIQNIVYRTGGAYGTIIQQVHRTFNAQSRETLWELIQLDAYSIALFAAMAVQPSYSLQVAINDFIVGCQEDGNWALIDVLWMLKQETAQGANLNFKAPALFPLTAAGAPVFVANDGYTLDGLTQYLNTGWDGNDGVNYAVDDSMLGTYQQTDNNNGGCTIGSKDAALNNSHIFPRLTLTQYGAIGGATDANVAVANGTGLTTAYRTAAGTQKIAKNGVQNATDAAADGGLTNIDFYIGAKNDNGLAANFYDGLITCAFTGSGSIDQLKMYNRISKYVTQVNAIP